MMKNLLLILMFFTLIGIGFSFKNNQNFNNDFVEYIVNPKKQPFKMFWKDEKQANFNSIENLKLWLNSNKKELVFATNGGMYHTGYAPVGLFIENKK